MKIHTTAIVGHQAELDNSVLVGPYAIIGEGVVIGADCEICAHTIITGPTIIGARNRIGPFSAVGGDPQDLKYKGEKTELVIGDNNIIREYVTIHRGTVDGGGVTSIGSHNLIMAYAHIAHDCKIGDHIVIANAATFGGHVEVEDRAIVGGLVGVHQFSRIGSFALVGAMSGVNKDVPPYVIAAGMRGGFHVSRINVIGLKRAGIDEKEIEQLKAAFKIIFRRPELLLNEALSIARQQFPDNAFITHLVNFFKTSKRSVLRSIGEDE